MRISLLLFIFFGFVFSSIAQHSLIIEIDKLSNNEGTVLLELLDGNEQRIQGVSQKIENNKCIIVIHNLKPGKYAFKYFHDKNRNKKLDTNWIGMPVEGFGFSNNAKGRFGPPSLEKMIFELNGETTLICTAMYFKK